MGWLFSHGRFLEAERTNNTLSWLDVAYTLGTLARTIRPRDRSGDSASSPNVHLFHRLPSVKFQRLAKAVGARVQPASLCCREVQIDERTRARRA